MTEDPSPPSRDALDSPEESREESLQQSTRRSFLAYAAAAAAGAVLASCTPEEREAYLQKRFRELSKEDVAKVVARLEAEYARKYGKPFKVGVEPAIPRTLFGYALDLSRCIGCRRCVYACVKENNQSRRSPPIQWISVLEMDKRTGVDVMESNLYYDPKEVPREGHFYMPVQCQQCRNPPCTRVCPVGATWQEPDGIVVVDYNWCVGCRCCMSACPYGARHFNWGEPHLPPEEANQETHYLGNRPRMRGVVEKCTFCIQRTRKGLYPACVEICPVGARKFGNLLDPESEVRYIIENKRVFLLKEELNTQPKFFYFYGV